MSAIKGRRKKALRNLKNLLILVFILFLFVGIPFLFLKYQADKSGMTIAEVLNRKVNRSAGLDSVSGGEIFADSSGKKIDFLIPEKTGRALQILP